MKFVENWRECWKWVSMQATAAASTLQFVWVGLPEDLKTPTASHNVAYATAALLGLAMFGRLVKQSDEAK